MSPITRTAGALPPGERTMSPFVLVDDADGLIAFVTEVFDGVENLEARTPMPSGLLIHAEVVIGDSRLLIADRQPGWPQHPGLVQVFVRDAQEVLDRAVARGGRVITEVTPFFGGEELARVLDPWGNLWWLYAPARGQEETLPWEGGSTYMVDSLDEHLRERAGA